MPKTPRSSKTTVVPKWNQSGDIRPGWDTFKVMKAPAKPKK